MGSSEGGQGAPLPWILKISAKNVVFLLSSGKKQISPLLPSLEKFWKNLQVPPWKKSFRRPCPSWDQLKAAEMETVFQRSASSFFLHGKCRNLVSSRSCKKKHKQFLNHHQLGSNLVESKVLSLIHKVRIAGMNYSCSADIVDDWLWPNVLLILYLVSGAKSYS